MNKIKQCLATLWQKIRAFWPWYKNLYKGRAWYTKSLIGFVSCIAAFFIYLGMVDTNFLWLFGKSPGFSRIMNPETHQASEIYSADGKLIGKFFNENRTPVKFEDVNPTFWKVLVDTEDERFYKHHGIDFTGMLAAAKDMIVHHDARGASTITQQLAKNMFRVRTQYSTGLLGYIPGIKMLVMKSKEWIIATKLELVYDKKDILTMYANTVDFGSNAFGIKTACKTYFNTTPSELTLDQMAVLVGMLKATTYYNPRINPKNSLKRRNIVLSNMLRHSDINRAQYDSISAKPITLNYSVESNYDGKALYYREYLANYLKDWCEENDYDLYSSGLKIYTTLDSRMQEYAEQAAIKQMKIVQRNFKNHWGNEEPWQDENHKVIPGFIEGIAKKLPVYKYLSNKFENSPDSIDYYLNKPHTVKLFDYEKGFIEEQMSTMDSIRYMVHFMHCAFVAMEPQPGAVKEWAGDINFKKWKYDKVTAMRQPGSTFKLFVYTEAMNQGLTPCDKRRDEYFSMQVFDKKKNQEVTWAPTNANGSFSGDSMALKSAFARSINSVAVRLGQEMGISRIVETAHKMGIKSPLDATPALALGSSDINLMELANSYCTIANDGVHHEPVVVTRIVDKDGKGVYTAPTAEEQAIPYRSAFFMQQLLMGGLREPGGTSMSFGGYLGDSYKDTDWGGKTGTSNNHSDAWFMGVSPKLVVGAWVGGEYRCIHFRTGTLGQGSRTALPICGYFVQALLSDPNFKQYHAKFGKPKDDAILSSMYNCASYYSHSKRDTLQTDSIHVEEEIMLDEEGNPIEHTKTSSDATEPKEKEKHHAPTEETVSFDNL